MKLYSMVIIENHNIINYLQKNNNMKILFLNPALTTNQKKG